MEYGAYEYRIDCIDDLAECLMKERGLSEAEATKLAADIIDGNITE